MRNPAHPTLLALALLVALLLGSGQAQLSHDFDRVCLAPGVVYVDGELRPELEVRIRMHFFVANAEYRVPQEIGTMCDGERDYNATASMLITTSESDPISITYNFHGRFDAHLFDRLRTLYGDPSSSASDRESAHEYLQSIGNYTETNVYQTRDLDAALEQSHLRHATIWMGLLQLWHD